MVNQISPDTPAKRLDYPYQLSKNSSISLDIIRAMSSQIVVLGHGISFLGIAPYLHEPRLPWMQNIAVSVFFVLSGLLITYSSLRKLSRGGYTFKIYFIERFSRIYTGYVPAIIFIFILDSAFVKMHGNISFPYPLDFTTFVGNMLMLQDYPKLNQYIPINVTSLGSGRPFWTLAVEWWIYIFFGSVLFIRNLKHLIFFSPLVVMSGMVVFSNAVLNGRGNGLFGVWLMGSAIAVLLSAPIKIRTTGKNIAISLIFLVFAFSRAFLIKSAYDPIFALFLTGSLYFALRWLDQKKTIHHPLLERIVKFFADYSFTLYLIHYSIFWFITYYKSDTDPYLLLIIGILLSNIVAALLAYFTEMRHKNCSDYLNKQFA